MLDIERCVNVDTARQNFLYILIPLGMPAAGRIRMCKFIYQNQLRLARQNRIDIHFFELMTPICNARARNDFKPFSKGFSLRSSVRFDNADDDIYSISFARAADISIS